MLLVDTIATCAAAIQKKASVQQKMQADEAFSHAIGRLSQVNDSLNETLTCMAELRNKNISTVPILHKQTQEELLNCVNICGRSLSEGTLDLSEVNAISANLKTAQAELAAAWARDAATYADGPMGYLTIISGLTDDPKAVRELAKSIGDIITANVSRKQINALVSKVNEANKITSDFPLKPEIETFLKKVSAQRATISDLTPNILEWLKEHKLLEKLKVNF